MWVFLLCAGTIFTFTHNNSVEQAEARVEEQKQNIKETMPDQDINNTTLYGYSSELPDDMLRISMPLYLSLMKQQYPDKSTSEIMLASTNLTNQEKTSFESLMNEEIEYFRTNYEKINFYVKDDTTGAVYTNNEALSSYLKSTENVDITKSWYLTFQRDSQGIFSHLKSSSVSSYFEIQTMASHMREMLQTRYFSRWEEFLSIASYETNTSPNNEIGSGSVSESGEGSVRQLHLQNMKNVSFVFEIQEGMISTPSDHEFVNYSYTGDYEHYYQIQQNFIYIGLLMFIFIIFFILPIQKCKESKLFQFFTRIPLEVIFISVIILITLISVCAFPAFLSSVYSGIEPWDINDIGYFMINIVYATIYVISLLLSFLFTASYAMILRNTFHVGFIKTLKEHSLCIIGLRSIRNFIIGIDFRSDNFHKILLFCFINAIFIIFMMILPFFFILIIPYSIFIIYYAQKLFRQFQKNYKDLEVVIEDVANGNFHNEINEDLGLFNSLKFDLQHLSESFEEAVAREVQSQNMKTELITNVSHDLKTPLTSIISYIDLLKNKDLSQEEYEQYLSILSTSSERLKHLIENLFEVSKANSGNIVLEKMRIDIVSLVQQVETECDALYKQRNLVVRNTFSDEKIHLYLDPQKTYRIFENLLSNAGKYAADNSRIYVSIDDYDSFIDIVIRNVSQYELNFGPDEIVERFTRGDASRNSEGSGLGLAIAKSFTELQEGTMRISIDGDLFKVSIRFHTNNPDSTK